MAYRQDLEGAVCRAYRRVSSEEQARSGFSLAAQQERLEQFAQSQGWRIIAHYEDDGYSAKTTDRPALRQLLSDAQPGEIILVYKLDRLTRSVLDLYELLKTFEEKQVLFKSATEEFNTTTANGRLMITLVTVIAQWERETISDRAAEGIRKKAGLGEWSGGPVPFGFRAVDWEVNGRKVVKRGRTLLQLVRDPDLAHIVEEIYGRYLAGHGIRSICNWLNEEKRIRTTKGNRWQATTVSRLLQNPIYCGQVAHGKRSSRKDAEVIRRKAVNVEPILSEALWEQVQSLFLTRRGMAPRLSTGDWPLVGVARCGICGSAITMSPHPGGDGRYYRCLGYVKALCGGKGRGRSLTSVPAHVVEGKVLELIQTLQHPAHLPRLFARLAEETRSRHGLALAERKRIQLAIAQAKAAIRQWDGLYERRRLTDEEYLEKTGPHKENLRALQAQLAELQEMPAPPAREELASFAVNASVAWEHLTPPEQKSMLLQFVTAFDLRILVYPGGRVALLPGSLPCDPSAAPHPPH